VRTAAAAAAAAADGGGGGAPVHLVAHLAREVRRGGCPRAVGALMGLIAPKPFGCFRV
jgi:hypothetical protein